MLQILLASLLVVCAFASDPAPAAPSSDTPPVAASRQDPAAKPGRVPKRVSRKRLPASCADDIREWCPKMSAKETRSCLWRHGAARISEVCRQGLKAQEE